jgi:hypothetical protein
MSDALQLHDSRVSRIEWLEGAALICFSQACLHISTGKPGREAATLWRQEAELVLWEAHATGPLPPLPNVIAEGFLEVGGIKHERIPLPFMRRVSARLHLQFTDGTVAEITGKRPLIQLLGTPVGVAASS